MLIVIECVLHYGEREMDILSGIVKFAAYVLVGKEAVSLLYAEQLKVTEINTRGISN